MLVWHKKGEQRMIETHKQRNKMHIWQYSSCIWHQKLRFNLLLLVTVTVTVTVMVTVTGYLF
jgi:hypothetical protein